MAGHLLFGRFSLVAKPTPIAIASFIGFYFVSISTLLVPYAPSRMGRAWPYILFVCLIAFTVYGGFIFRHKPTGMTGWQYIRQQEAANRHRRRKLTLVVLSLPLFCALVAFSLSRLWSLPTKWLASESVVLYVDCQTSEQYGKAIRNMVLVDAIEISSGAEMTFPWKATSAPKCPGRIRVAGRSGYWGTFVEHLEKVNNVRQLGT